MNFYLSRSLYGRAAFALIGAATVITSTSLLDVAWRVFERTTEKGEPAKIFNLASQETLPFIFSGCLILLATYFIKKAEDSKTRRIEENRLIFETKSAEIAKVSSSRIHVYCGSVTEITNISVIVTSENSDLNLGSISGTSVSGRMRSLAATRSVCGEVTQDNLEKFINNWKVKNNKYSNFNLGTCLLCDSPYQAATIGIEKIIFAVGIQKNPSGVATITEESIRKIVSFSFDAAVSGGHASVFLPIFGLGSGNVPQAAAIKATVDAVVTKLRSSTSSLDIYLGVYRFDDLSKLCLYLSHSTL